MGALQGAVMVGLASRAPAPIVEESLTPTPTVSPKPKRTRERAAAMPNAASEKSSPLPQPKPAVLDPFDGPWTGTHKRGWAGELQHTYVISGHGTLLRETIGPSETHVWNATCDGTTMRWSWSLNVSGVSTFTPTRDGKTAVFTVKTTGFGAYETSTLFHRISP
jgi:hypothetical protein